MAALYRPRPIEWLYLAGGLPLVLRYLWFMDDAFIYFRYVDNLLFLKIGLVYNHGEYVEGFSSPFWTMLMAALRATGLDYLTINRLIGLLSYALFWFLLVQLNRRMSAGSETLNFPLVYLGFNYAVLSYFASSVESPLVQVIAIVYALYILRPSSRWLQMGLALSPLVRHELLVPFLICLVWSWISRKRFPRLMFLSLATVLGAWMIFRIYYYADLLPNTFYLKDTVNVQQGLVYLNETLRTYHLYTVAAVFAALVILLRRRQEVLHIDKRVMMIIVAASVAAYVVKIGGDHRHYRYLAFSFPLAVCASAGILEDAYAMLLESRHRWLMPLGGVVLIAVVLSFYPPQLSKHPFFRDVEHRVVNEIADAAGPRSNPALKYDHWGPKVTIESLKAYRDRHPEFEYAGISSSGWCHRNYLQFDRRTIHLYGLTDAVLARTEMEAGRPGHKHRLSRQGKGIVKVYASADSVGPGMYARAVDRGDAPAWVSKNMESIETIERKIFNDHDLLENLKLAFTFPEKIKP